MFMEPEIEFGLWVRYECKNYEGGITPAEYVADLPDDAVVDKPEEGYCARLSAAGYLDCTEYVGPFTTASEAAHELFTECCLDCDDGTFEDPEALETWRSFLRNAAEEDGLEPLNAEAWAQWVIDDEATDWPAVLSGKKEIS